VTAIVAIEHDGKVYMGCDSAGLIEGTWDLRLRSEIDDKIVCFPDKHLIIGVAGSGRWLSLLTDHYAPPDELEDIGATTRGYVAKVVESLRTLAKEYGALHNETPNHFDSSLLIGYQGGLWSMDSDFALMKPYHSFAAIGCGDQTALGSIMTSFAMKPSEDKREVLYRALRVAECFSAGVRAPFVVKSV